MTARKAKDLEREWLEDMEWLGASVRGRRLLVRLLRSAGYLDGPGVNLDPNLALHLEGRRFVAAPFFAALLTHRPERFSLALAEWSAAREPREAGDEPDEPDDPGPGDDPAYPGYIRRPVAVRDDA